MALALALELCRLPVHGLADGVCLLELLVEGPSMTDRCHLAQPTLALTRFVVQHHYRSIPHAARKAVDCIAHACRFRDACAKGI